MRIAKDITELIGKTPLLEMKNYAKAKGIEARLVGKLEYMNPAGSVKDRVAYNMIKTAEESGQLKKNSVIIEPTSGNTGIGLAAVAAARGYRVILTMPDTMSVERRKLLTAYGAEVVLTDGTKGMSGAIARAEELANEIENSFLAGQFVNPANPEAHYRTTGPEIWEDTDGKVDLLVATIGTGGTLSGTARYLKEQTPDIKIIGVEPSGSPVLTEGKSGAHKIQGIGAGFIPEILDTELYDEVIAITDREAYSAAREIARTEGVLVGISSGAAVAAAEKLAKLSENKGKLIVVILPDTGDRYLSTEGLFE